MRRIKLILATLIGIVGTIIYFVSIPTINEDGLINLQVVAGDAQSLEDIYFTGYLESYSSFYLDQDELKTTGDLSYLETLDAPYNMILFNLQEDYPELINPLYYDNKVSLYSFLDSEEYVMSSHMKENEHNYYLDGEKVYLNILDKESGEIEEEIITRDDAPVGDHIEIIGMYEKFPTMKFVYHTTNWNEQTGFQGTSISLGEYNIETKTYSEELLLNNEGDFGTYSDETTLLENQDKQLFTYFDYSLHDYQVYVLDYTTNEFSAFDHEDKKYTIANDGSLYSVGTTVGETTLTQYGESIDEVIQEVTLEHPVSDHLSDEQAALEMEVIDNKLYVVHSTINYDETTKVSPSDVQVFDVETGERLTHAKVHYDEKNEVNAFSGNIVKIGHRTDK